MLEFRVKRDIDLEVLLDYGFVKKYNEFNRELVSYVSGIEYLSGIVAKEYIKIFVNDIKDFGYRDKTYLRRGLIKIEDENIKKSLSIMFDLTKDGIIEKVDSKNLILNKKENEND